MILDSGITIKQWCGICNSKEAAGTLTVEEPLSGQQLDLPACQPCVDQVYRDADQLGLW